MIILMQLCDLGSPARNLLPAIPIEAGRLPQNVAVLKSHLSFGNGFVLREPPQINVVAHRLAAGD